MIHRLLLLVIGSAVLLAACGLGDGPTGTLTLGLQVDDSTRDFRITAPVSDRVAVDQPFWVRLELDEPTEATEILVRLSRRVGESFQSQDAFTQTEIPPWTVAVMPVTLPRHGEWDIGVFLDRQKVQDIRLTAER